VLNAVVAVPATRTGMPEECALSLDNLMLVPKELFRARITRFRSSG